MTTSQVEARLKDMGLTVPEVATPVASYVPAVISGQYVYTSGQIPVQNGEFAFKGKVSETGADGTVSLNDAIDQARVCALNTLAAVKSVIGDLDRVKRVVKVTGFVSSDPEFTGQAQVLNGASELYGKAFGEAGIHARSAVGVAVLPLDVPVEVELIVEYS
ncbi:RidA family protein [Kocuria sp. HSID16901]|mgnify:CR=1 FL=1|uniref:RidA family protein n=1 Tax=Kocuria sp. HSID16901 TaxID=2419505 RepID=UPI000660E41C|nr:RidA family protein [Kocuria sp. HSID16901]MCT1367938.1 RidA family protein [Rothia sp. p3-SID1597]RUQ23282.1 RidA family protein [Kocuria sp. HSID16901]